MATKPPASGYRTPHSSDHESRTSRQTLYATDLPVLGAVELSQGLHEPLILRLNRNHLQLGLGEGLHLQFSSPVPALEIRGLGLDLNSFDVTLDAEGLGPLCNRLASIGVREVSGRVLGIDPVGYRGPGDSLVHDFLDGLDDDDAGCRKFYEAALPFGLDLGIWLSPDAELSAEVSGEQIALNLTRPLVLRAPLVRLGIDAVTYRFSDGHLALVENTPNALWLRRWVNRALLFIISYWARRALKDYLPATMLTPGYNLFTDPDLGENLATVKRQFGGQDPQQSSPKASPFAHLFEGGLTCKRPPEGAQVLHRLTPAPGIALAVCCGEMKQLHVEKDTEHVGFDAGAGVYLHCDQIPDLSSIRITGGSIGLPGGQLAVDLDPPPGKFVQALISHVGTSLVLPRVPDKLRPHIGLGVADPAAEHLLVQRELGGGREVAVVAQANTRVDLDYTPQAIVASVHPPLAIELQGQLEFLPNLVLAQVRYELSDGAVGLATTPPVGELEQALISAAMMVATPLLPEAVRPDTPGKFAPPADDLTSTHAVILHQQATPAGPVFARLADADQLTVRVSPTTVQIDSSRGIVIHSPTLGLAIEFTAAQIDLAAGDVQLTLKPACGQLLTGIASSAVSALVLPQLKRFLPPPPKPGEPWVVRRVEVRPGQTLQLSIPPSGALTIVRTTNKLALRAERGLRVSLSGELPVPEFSLHDLRWDLSANRWSVTTAPTVGPATQVLVNRVIERFLPAALTDWLSYLGLPKPPPPTSKAPPPLHGPVVFSRELPQLGVARIALDLDHSLRVSLSREQIELSFGRGLTLRSLGLNFTVQLVAARLSLGTRFVELETKPALGDLEHQILRRSTAQFLERVLSDILPEPSDTAEELERVLTLARKTPFGPVHVCLPTGRNLELVLDKKGCALRSTAGAQLRGNSDVLKWLPIFSLHELRYAFSSGDMSIDISGIEERFYQEEDDVSPITEAIFAHLFRLFVAPKIPDFALKLGFIRHTPPPPICLPTERIGLFAAQIGAMGGLFITMDPDDTLEVRASGEEVSISCLLGLQLALPDLRLQLEVRHARYHPQSGEVQLGGLGQLENALIEAVLRKKFGPVDTTSESNQEPLAGLLNRLPRTADNKRKLYESPVVNLYMHAKTRFSIRFGAEGLELVADPPISVDGPAIVDYHFEGLSYEFSEGRFRVELAEDGAVPEILTDILVAKIEKRLGRIFAPLLPQAMREKSYNLAEDPHSVETIAALFANVSSAKNKRRG